MRRGLLTVIDSTALDAKVRARYRALAAAAGVACHAVVVDTPERECRARNRGRPEAVPSAVLSGQLRSLRRQPSPRLDEDDHEGFADVHRADGEPVVTVPASALRVARARPAARRRIR